MPAFFLGKRKFYSLDEIVEFVKATESFNPKEDGKNLRTLLIFKTSKQRTWLITTRARLYCILDDIRKPEPGLQWSLERNELVSNDDVKAPISTEDHEERTGLLNIGPAREWLYSKALFSDRSLEDSLVSSIRETMIEPEGV